MKNKALSTFLIFFILVASATVASAGTETQLTQDERLTSGISFYGNHVYWTETAGNGVHAYDLTTGKRTDIDGHFAYSQINSYGNKVVWTGDDGEAVYMYDISTGNETKISPDGSFPDIYGNYVVYTNNYYDQDHKNDSIYLYDLNTGNETKIATVHGYPAIYDKTVVWSQANSNNGYDIYKYNTSTNQISIVTTADSSIPESELDIYGDTIVWTESYNLYMYDMASHKKTQITNSGNVSEPVIYGKWIVYAAGDLYRGDIYVYEISTAKTTRITTSNLAFSPSIYGDKVVYADLRNPETAPDVRDIYLYDLSNTSNNIVANFTSNITLGIAPLNISFTDTSTGTPNAWYWDFGDGAISNERDPTHTYLSAGNYTACLTVSNANGIDSKLATINVIRPAVYAYITSSLGVYVIDTTTNTVTTRIDAGNTHGVTVSQDGTKVYATNFDSDGIVSVIDASTNTVTARVKVGAYPEGVAVSPDGTNVYVANWRSGNVSVIDTTTNTIKATVNLGGNPCGVAVTSDGKKVYVSNWHGHAISVIDATTNNIITTVPVVGDSSYGVVVSPDGKKVYVANYNGKNISVIDTTTDTVTATIEVGHGPRGIAVSPDGKKVYVANEDKTVSVIDTATKTVIAVVNMISKPFGIAVTPDGKNVYVANTGEYYENISNFDHNVSVIDTATNTVKTTVEVGYIPIAFGQFIGGKPVLPVDVPVLPVANFTVNPASGYSPLTVQFTDLSQNAAGWNWDFGDGATSTLQNPVHTYELPGSYIVNLTLSNENVTASVTASKTATITVTKKSSSGGNSGGSSHSSSGGGAGGSPEPATNVEVKELSQTIVTSGNSAKFDFLKNATSVVYVSFDSKKTAGKTTTTVEMLKNKSTLTSDTPTGEVYKYLNIWVGSSGFGTSKNIENAVVCFKVEKSWIQDKNIEQSSITLNRYSDKKWNQLSTNLSGEDDRYLYFTAKTPGFSSFAITGKTKATGTETQSAVDDTQNESTAGRTTNVEQIPEQKQSLNTSGKESTKTPGFEIASGAICLLSVFMFKKR